MTSDTNTFLALAGWYICSVIRIYSSASSRRKKVKVDLHEALLNEKGPSSSLTSLAQVTRILRHGYYESNAFVSFGLEGFEGTSFCKNSSK